MRMREQHRLLHQYRINKYKRFVRKLGHKVNGKFCQNCGAKFYFRGEKMTVGSYNFYGEEAISCKDAIILGIIQ